METKSWKKINEHKIFDGYRIIYQKKFRLPNGKEGNFDIITQNNPVCILALTKSGEVILARQFRPGPEKIFDELPSGLLEDNETPLTGAQRELVEETGYIGEFTFVGTFPEWAYSNSLMYCFVAQNCMRVQKPNTDDEEFISVVLKLQSTFITQVRKGQLTNVDAAYRCLDYLKML